MPVLTHIVWVSAFKPPFLDRTSWQSTIMAIHHDRDVRMSLREDSTCMAISLLNTPYYNATIYNDDASESGDREFPMLNRIRPLVY